MRPPALLLFAAAAVAQTPLADSVAEAVRREMAACALPALSIALVDGGDVVWSSGYGKVRVGGDEVPCTAATVWHMASISKLLTGMACARAAERGQLDLDAPVAALLPDVVPPGGGDRVTLRHLLTHTGGVTREPPVGHYFDLQPPALADVVASLAATPLVSEPGTAWKYSNAGVAWAGRVLEAQLGVDFADGIEREWLRPLGMAGASFRAAGRGDVAQGHMWSLDGRDVPTPEGDLGLGPAANLCASVEDLARLAQGWFLGEHRQPHAPLAEDTMRALLAPRVGTFQGTSFFLADLDGARQVGHDGAWYGVASSVQALPEEGLAVALATSVDFASGPLERLAAHALRCLRAQRRGDDVPPPPPARTPLAPADAGDLLGDWVAPDGAVLEVVHGHQGVFLRPVSGTWARLMREASGGLSGRDRLHGELAVHRDGDALVVAGVRHARRADEPPPPCPDRLRPYLGEYGWQHDVLYVLERHGRLGVLIEWLAEYPLTEVDAAAGRFALDPRRGMYRTEAVEFERDGDGAVVAARVGAVRFPRLALPGAGTFRIAPRHPPERLRAMAEQARAPKPTADALPFDLVELRELDETIHYDIRYASDDNFMGMTFYDRASARMQRPAAEAVVRVHRRLRERGLGVLVHDAYRPWKVTKMFWDATPDAQRHFVANPQRGSRHNRGCAIDLSLCDAETGAPVTMPSGYDEFTARAYPGYPGGSSRQRWFRELLRREMEAERFAVYEFEWWHFDFHTWRRYPVQ